MKVVGISACPAGLAHTPMAAKALEKAGKKIGFDVKMEQQGSMGQVNAITKEEAQAADFVLIASDQHIEGMDRFEGKPVIRVNITTCIKAPEAVLKKCAAFILPLLAPFFLSCLVVVPSSKNFNLKSPII